MRKPANPRAAWISLSPRIGLLYSQILLLLGIMGTLVFHFAWQGSNERRQGLFVLTYFPESWQFRRIECQEWAVQVQSGGVLYLNSVRIEPNDLPNVLRAQIGTRKDCIVFFDAEPDVVFADAIRAIDLIEETPGRVVLLTPRTGSYPIAKVARAR
jgi:hypothetical protein